MKFNISIVVATNNAKLIKIFLNNLYKNVELPSQIIVVIPKIKKNNFLFLKKYDDSLEIIYSEYENQVFQRIEGFKHSINDYVLQIDDDIKYNHAVIKNLASFLNKEHKACIAPNISNNRINTWMNSPKLFKSKFYKLISFINHGYLLFEPGKFSHSGINMHFDTNCKDNYEVEWLPGGCILHKKNNLILNNYYPYKFGKSFSEDLFHSKELNKNNIKLIFSPYLTLFLSENKNIKINLSNVINIFKSIIIMNKFVISYGGNLIRLNLTLILYYLWLFIYKIKYK